MGEVDLLLLLAPFEHGEVDDPAEAEDLFGDQVQLLPDAGARQPGELVEDRRIARDEEGRIARLEAKLGGDGRGALFANVLGDGAGGAFGVLVIRRPPEDIAETRLSFALRPTVHPVAKGAVAGARRGDGPHPVFRIGA